MKNVALLRASYSDTAVRNFRREVPAQVRSVDMHSEKFDSKQFNPELYDGLIISGSKASVLDQQNWIEHAKEAVRKAVEEHNIPTLGVCWGNQLLAHTFGGEVKRGEDRELGFRNVSQTKNEHPILRGIEQDFTAFESHTDYVTKIPSDAELLAKNEVGNQAFSYKSAVGIQFHPEVDYRTAIELIKKYQSENTVPNNPDKSLDSWALAEESSDVLRNFVWELIS